MEASAKKYIYLHSAVVQRPMPQWANVFFASDWLGTKLGLCNLQTDSSFQNFPAANSPRNHSKWTMTTAPLRGCKRVPVWSTTLLFFIFIFLFLFSFLKPLEKKGIGEKLVHQDSRRSYWKLNLNKPCHNVCVFGMPTRWMVHTIGGENTVAIKAGVIRKQSAKL
jgi:hypothetical protein